MFPKKAFITFINDRYQNLVERLIKSIDLFSNYPIIVYTFNFDYNTTSNKCFIKRLNDVDIKTPVFNNQSVDNLGIVERGDFNTYYTLSRKHTVILDAINNGLEEGIFLDADGIVRENIDTSFEYLKECQNYPLVGKGLFEFMILYGKGNPFEGDVLELPIMNLFGVENRSMHYVQTNFFVFNKNCKNFFEECVKISNDKHVLNHNLLYAPYHDETILNLVLWKYNAKKHLPIVHFNLSNYESLVYFYKTDITNSYVNDSIWHFIPKDKNDIKFFHGCKSTAELDMCLNFLEKNKNINFPVILRNDQTFKRKKIAIVTLFDKNYETLANLSLPNKIDYANKHNYDFIYFNDTLDESRPPQWSKVKAIEYVLKQNYDWVWWIDIDALIMEFDIMLESIVDDNYDIIFTSNKYSYLSNGSSFFKNTKTTLDFLNDCYQLKLDCLKNVNINVFDHEQQSMRQLILNEEKYKSKVKLIDERCCNSFCVTQNKDVLSCYPNWNSEPNIYQKGDFVIQFCGRNLSERIFDFQNYNKNVNKGHKNIVIIDFYGIHESKLSILKNSIQKIKNKNEDILLVAHCTVPDDIINSVNYFIYDSDNTPNEKNLSQTWYNIQEKYETYIKVSSPDLETNVGHEYPIIKSMRNAFNFANILGYENFCFMEFDNYFEKDELYKIKELQSDILFKNKKAHFFKVFCENKFAFETIFFLGNVSYFANLLNDESKFPKNIKDFNKKLTWDHPFSLEHIFCDTFSKNYNDCIFIEKFFIDFFNKNKNLSSYVSINFYILPEINTGDYYLILSNSNKIDIKVMVSLNDQIILDLIVNNQTFPSLKLTQDGTYTISFFEESGNCLKTNKFNYFKNDTEKYNKYGYLKIK